MIIEVKLSERAQETRGKITFITLNATERKTIENYNERLSNEQTARQLRKTNRIRYNTAQGAMESLAADHSPSCRPSCVILNLVARALWNVSIDERQCIDILINTASLVIIFTIFSCIITEFFVILIYLSCSDVSINIMTTPNLLISRFSPSHLENVLASKNNIIFITSNNDVLNLLTEKTRITLVPTFLVHQPTSKRTLADWLSATNTASGVAILDTHSPLPLKPKTRKLRSQILSYK
uniref:Uncharacterized protein n=1 Tax=Heterorhabditis bacteriophora TaxID=37862 RepID=A0A1I7XVS8_HETBA